MFFIYVGKGSSLLFYYSFKQNKTMNSNKSKIMSKFFFTVEYYHFNLNERS